MNLQEAIKLIHSPACIIRFSYTITTLAMESGILPFGSPCLPLCPLLPTFRSHLLSFHPLLVPPNRPPSLAYVLVVQERREI